MHPEAAPASAALSSGPLSYLPEAVRVPRSALAAILVGWPLALLPSLALSLLANFLFPQVAGPVFEAQGPGMFALLVLFSPILETLIMAGVLSVLLRLVSPSFAILASSIGWGVAHSLAAPSWGLVIWWPFLVFSTLFTVWRERSLWLALAIPAAVHMLQNLGPALLVATGQLS
jgi:membrane protease YdiL (CAAX protease family)